MEHLIKDRIIEDIVILAQGDYGIKIKFKLNKKEYEDFIESYTFEGKCNIVLPNASSVTDGVIKDFEDEEYAYFDWIISQQTTQVYGEGKYSLELQAKDATNNIIKKLFTQKAQFTILNSIEGGIDNGQN